jgi:DNA-binding transcriptional LysR family regulator
VEAAETGLDAERQMPRGMIRISLPLSFGQRYLAPLLVEFAARHPEVELNMDFTDRRANLIEEGIDLAVRITDQHRPQDVVRQLGKTRMVVAASPAYLERHGEPQRPSDLACHECLTYTLSSTAAWPFEVDGTLVNIPIHGRIQANNGDALLQAAIHGLGICFQPAFIAFDALKSGELRPILSGYETPEVGIYAVLPGNRHIPLRVRMLIDFLAQRLGEAAEWNRL